MSHRTYILCIAALSALAGTHASLAQCIIPTKILASNRQSGDAFGASAAISAGYLGAPPRLLIGAWGDNAPGGVDAGSVYTYFLDNGAWSPGAQIFPADGQPSDTFGTAVDVDDPAAIISAPGVDDTGAAYIFERSGGTWVQTAKIIPSGSQPNDEVGRSVAINGTWLAVIGCPGRDVDLAAGGGDSDPDAGVVVLAEKVNNVWTTFQTLPARSSADAGEFAGDRYGSAVAAAGNLVVCGAPNGTLTNWPENHGYVDLYRAGGPSFTLTNRITAVGPQADDHFGAAVATDANFLAIGAPDDDINTNQIPGISAKLNNGSVTIYRWEGTQWSYDGQIFAQDPSDNARFGAAVSIDNDHLVVSAVGAKKTYVFRRVADARWAQIAMLTDPDDETNGAFARSVATAEGQIVIGDRDDETAGFTNHGAAYSMPFPANNVASDACEGAGVISGHGTYSGCTSNATLNGESTCGAGGANGYGPDVFYAWTPRCSGNVIIDTFGSAYDTVLSVHTACPATIANTIACSDDASGLGTASLVTFNYTAGTTYIIRIAGYNSASGNFTLRVIEPAAPGNDTCASALTISSGTTVFDSCRAASNLLLGPSCAVGGGSDLAADMWFRYVAPCNGTTHISSCGSNFDTIIEAFSSPCPIFNAAAIACNDDAPQGTCINQFNTLTSAIDVPTTAGQVLLIRIGGWENPNPLAEVGHGILSVSCAPTCPCDWNQSGLVSVQDIFDFLAGYFSGSGDFNQSGATSVQDIFDFLACYFAGCA